ncbi:MAG: two-component sensor histidine kinase, partial [Planctomycetota bacterium]
APASAPGASAGESGSAPPPDVRTSPARDGEASRLSRMEEPKSGDGRTVAFWLAMLVPLGLIAIVAAVVYAVTRVLGG